MSFNKIIEENFCRSKKDIQIGIRSIQNIKQDYKRNILACYKIQNKRKGTKSCKRKPKVRISVDFLVSP